MLKPKNPARTDLFLNVMQCQDAETPELPVTMIGSETDDMVGALIHDCVAMFSTNGKILNKEIMIPAVNTGGTVKYHIADLASGQWNISDGLELTATIDVADGGNFGYFEAAGDKFYILTPTSPAQTAETKILFSGSPQIISAVVEATTMIITFDKPLDDTVLDRSRFRATGVKSNTYASSGGGVKIPRFASAVVSEDRMSVILELQNTALGKDTDIKINYFGDGNIMAEGIALEAFDDVPVKNNTYVMDVPPEVKSATVKGNKIELRFSIALYGKNPVPEALKIEGVNGNSECKVTKLSVDNTVLTLTIDRNSIKGDEIYISYEKNDSPLTDGRNEVEPFKVKAKNNNRAEDLY
jgi:hypothetical protein